MALLAAKLPLRVAPESLVATSITVSTPTTASAVSSTAATEVTSSAAPVSQAVLSGRGAVRWSVVVLEHNELAAGTASTSAPPAVGRRELPVPPLAPAARSAVRDTAVASPVPTKAVHVLVPSSAL